MDKNRYFQIRSRKCIKTKVADIQRLYSKWLWLVMAVYKTSFADAELAENGTQNLVGRNFSCNGPQMVQHLTNLFAH